MNTRQLIQDSYKSDCPAEAEYTTIPTRYVDRNYALISYATAYICHIFSKK